MNYEVLVTRKGTHYFATAPRSLIDITKALEVYEDLKGHYPEAEGFTVTLFKLETKVQQVSA